MFSDTICGRTWEEFLDKRDLLMFIDLNREYDNNYNFIAYCILSE